MAQKFEQRQMMKKFSVVLLAFFFALQACGSTDPELAQDANSTQDAAEQEVVAAPETPADSEPAAAAPAAARVSQTALAEECINLALASPAIDIGAGLPAGYEPSGASWHSRLKKIFTVHDGGLLSMMNKDGSSITTWNVGGDLEGVAIANPDSKFVYIGREHSGAALELRAAILEFNIEAGVVTRTFLLDKNDFPPSQGSGLEALAFVEKAGHTEGGEFWAGHQGNGGIYVFNLPIVSSADSTTATLVNVFQPVPGRTDLAGLDYSSEYHVVYAIYDGSNRLAIVRAEDGTFFSERALPQNDQEGIAVNNLCDLFIAQDTNKKFWFYKGRE